MRVIGIEPGRAALASRGFLIGILAVVGILFGAETARGNRSETSPKAAFAAFGAMTESPPSLMGGVQEIVESRRRTIPQFSPGEGTEISFSPGTITVTITWCAEEPLLSGSRAIRLNGAAVTGSFTYVALGGTSPCFDEGMALARSVGTVTLQEGVNRIVASICSEVICGTDSVTYTRLPPPEPAPTQSVRVTPGAVSISTAAFAVDTQQFVVKSLASTQMTFTLDATCDRSAVLTCAPSASSVVLNPAESTFVRVVYTAGPVDAAGPIRLRAYRNTNAHDQDDGSVQVTVGAGAPASMRVRVSGAQQATAIAKDLCLTVALTRETAVSCGDLRVVHPLPAITVRNRTRQPTLIYDSRSASGTALLAAAVTMPAGATPTKVTATVSVQDTAGTWSTATTGDWVGTPFTPGLAMRIALAWEMAGGSGTRLVPYRLDVTAWDGAAPRATVRDSGAFAFVDRSTSALGAGWWLAGLERLYSAKGAAPKPTDSTLLWVGGDGSTRRFVTVDSETWVGDSVDFGETIKWEDGNSWFQRRLPDGTRVLFDTSGRHTQTLDRLDIATSFAYDGSGRLTAITPAGLSSPTHFLDYPSDTLVRVCAQTACADTTTRRDSLFVKSGRLDSIRGVGGRVRFTTDGLRRITARWDRRGTKTSFAFVGRAGLLYEARTYSDTVEWRRQRFIHGQGNGLGHPDTTKSATPLLEAATWIDGPRDDLEDTSRVWLDPFGAPRRVRDALGHSTTLSRGDRRFPALVTEARAPTGFTTWAMYDAHGNLAVQGAQSPYGDSRNPKTTYEWDATWAAVTRVINPAGDSTRVAYDATTGNRTEVIGPRGEKTCFRYVGGSGLNRGLLEAVEQPYDIVETYSYDTRGNLMTIVAPDAAVTSIERDALGRETLRTLPITTGKTEQVRTTYDVRDRPVTVQRSGPAMNYALRSFPSETITVAPETLTVSYVYDAESNLTSTSTTGTGEYFPVVSETNVYDLAHAVVERSSAGAITTISRDKAGNPVATRFPGETLWVASSFDALNREVMRVTPEKVHQPTTCTGYQTGPLNDFTCEMVFPIFPNHSGGTYRVAADTAVFTFDANGNRLTAVNGTVALRWTYYPGGAVRTDSAGGDGFRVTYDWNGRRVSVANGGDSLRYHYHPYGALRRITLPGQGFFRFTHDSLTRVDSILAVPAPVLGGALGGMIETRKYDALSRLHVRRRVSAALGDLNLDTLRYDARDRLSDVSSGSRVVGIAERITFAYAGLGSLVAQERTRGAGAPIIEQFSTNAVGTVLQNRTRSGAAPQDTGWFGSTYNATGALMGRGYLDPPPSGQWYVGRLYSDDTEQSLEAGGRVRRSGRVERRIASDGGNPPAPTPVYSRQEATRNFFGADGRLAATQRYVWTPIGLAGSWEVSRYDALGRRHQVVVNRASGSLCEGTAAWCRSYTETTLWDGDAPLVESRGTPVRYVPGLQLDQPLALWDGRVFNPSWRGALESSVWMNGAAGDQSLGTGVVIDWAQQRSVYWTPGPGASDALPPDYTWVGNAATGYLQTTGQLYRRNRHYDPLSGQFTQMDPIGLAGGANLFGFVGGDPVNFSDPFGLCPESMGGDGKTDLLSDCAEGSKGYEVFRNPPGLEFATPPWEFLGSVQGTARAALRNAVGRVIGARTVNQLNQQVRRGQAPRSVKRVDRARHPHEQDNVHFDDGRHALSRNGEWKHGGRELTSEEREWLLKGGWTLPPQ